MTSRMILLAMWLGSLVLVDGDVGDVANQRQSQKEALSSLQTYVGSWKGVGQLRRGSSRGSWIAQTDWAWQFTDDTATLEFNAVKSKYFRTGTETPDP